jgi:tetratricopeptide (TPR) repeat protein/TolB-like protein
LAPPDYLSPEQAKGETVDARSDLYSLGIIVFEMLSGTLPFPGGSLAETLSQRIAGRPRELAAIGVNVSPRMHELVRRCLDPSPDRRFASAGELLEALDRPESHFGRLRRRGLALGGSLLALLTVAALVYYGVRTLGKRAAAVPVAQPTSIAVLPLSDETGLPTLAWMSTGIPDMVVDTLAQSPTLRVVDASHVSRTLQDLKLDHGPWTDATLRRIAELFDAQRLVVGSARAHGATLRVDAQLVRVDRAGSPLSIPIAAEADNPGELVRAFTRDVRRALDLPAPDTAVPVSDVPEALAAFHRGAKALSRGDASDAENRARSGRRRRCRLRRGMAAAGGGVRVRRQARSRPRGRGPRAVAALQGSGRLAGLAQARQASLRGEPENAQKILIGIVDRYPQDVDTAVTLAEAYGQSGQLTEAIQVLEKVVAKAPNHPRGWYLLGKYSILSGEPRKAVDDYLVRAQVVQNNLRSERGRADVQNAFGVAYRELGELEQAQARYDEAAQLRRQAGDQRGYATTLRNLAQIQTARGEYPDAQRTVASAMAIFDTLGDRAGRADAVNDLGVMEEGRGNYKPALDHYREALQIRHEIGDRRAEAESLNNVGYANQLLGNSDNASVYWHQALALYKETGNREGEILVTQSLGQLETAQGRWDDAVKSYLKALDQGRESEMEPAAAASLGYLGRLAQYQGRYAAAFASYAEALRVLEGLKDTRGLTEFTLARADLNLELGLTAAAAADLEKAALRLRQDPNHEQQAEALRLGARLRTQRGDRPGARAMLQKARAEAAASQSAAALARIEIDEGLLLLYEGRVADSVRGLEAALARADRLGDAAVRLAAGEAAARAALKAGDTARAERILGPALRLAATCGSYGGSVRLYRLQASAARKRGDERAATAADDRAAAELKRLQQGLEAAPSAALAQNIVEVTR